MRPSILVPVATLALLVGSGAPLHGHAVLTRTSLEEGATVRANTSTTVTLRFNAGIEDGFSKVVLIDERQAERVLEVLPGSEPATVSVAVPALAPGSYGLRYKVLATDGHVTESVLRFKVAPPD
jgi:methionine-rich copper-binding protein CopC